MPNGRKMIVCTKCSKYKQHFGRNMCSSCLRKFKRQNKPSFYLGTCYSEMKRRVKTYDKLRPNYYNLPICSKDEFINRFLNDPNFLKLFKEWKRNGFTRKSAPSIDRIDNNKGYDISNLQFIRQGINSVKDVKIKILLVNNESEHTFDSCKEAAGFLGISASLFCRERKQKNSCRGYAVYEIS